MASTNTLQTIFNGPRTAVIMATQISDGTNNETVKIYDATSGGNYGVTIGGQTFYPGIYTRVVALDYDVQDMKIAVEWEATSDTPIFPLGSAPEDFSWRKIGGIVVPTGLAGATGSIKVKTLNPIVGAVYTVIITIHKGVPQS